MLQTTLRLVEATFYKKKPMRTVIMWESQDLSHIGEELLEQIDRQLKVTVA